VSRAKPTLRTRFATSPRREALHDAQLRTVEPLDDEALDWHLLEQLAEQVVGLEANRERGEQALAQAGESRSLPPGFCDSDHARSLRRTCCLA
jgi:hypothetical protein